MCQAEQQGNTAAPSVPVQWSEGQLVLTPADWVIAIRLTDWAMEFMSRPIVAQLDARICRGRRGEAKQALKAAVDVQMAMLRLCFAQMLDRVYSSAHTVESVAFGTEDCIAEDCLRHWASDDAEQDPIIGWISVGCSSRPPARLADIMMATSGMPDYRYCGCRSTTPRISTCTLAHALAVELRVSTVWARDNTSILDVAMKNCAAKEWVVAMKDLAIKRESQELFTEQWIRRKGPAAGDVSDGGVCEMIRAAVAARSKAVHQPVANLAPASGVPKPKRRAAPKRVRRGGHRVKERRAFLEAIAAGVRGTTGDAAVEAALGSAGGAAGEQAALNSVGGAAAEEGALGSAGGAAVEAALGSARGAAAEEAALGSARDAAVEAALGLAGGAAAGEAALNSAGGAPVEGALGSARGAAKPAGATQGAAKPAGATQSAAKPAGAMQSAAKPASATQSADRSWCLACTCLGVQRMAASWYRSSKWSFGCHGWCITVSSAGAALCAAPASGAALCAAPSPAGNAAPAEATISAAPAATAENAAPAAAATSRHAAPAAAQENAAPKNATSAAMNAAPDLRLQATLTEEEMQAVFEAAKRAGRRRVGGTQLEDVRCSRNAVSAVTQNSMPAQHTQTESKPVWSVN